MDLTDENLTALMDKIAEEVAELQQGRQHQQSLGPEVDAALQQSRELVEELQAVKAMLADARSAGRRLFSQDERAALSYFGFRVPPDGRPPPAAATPAAVQQQPAEAVFVADVLPQPRRSLSMANSEAPETETDIADVVRAPSLMVSRGWGLAPQPQQYRQHVVTVSPHGNKNAVRGSTTAAPNVSPASRENLSFTVDFTARLPLATSAAGASLPSSSRSSSSAACDVGGERSTSSSTGMQPSHDHNSLNEEVAKQMRSEYEARIAMLEREKADLAAQLASRDASFREQLLTAELKFREEFESLLASADDLAVSLDKVTREKDEQCAAQQSKTDSAVAQLEALEARMSQAREEARTAAAAGKREVAASIQAALPELRAAVALCQALERVEARKQQQRAALLALANQPLGVVRNSVSYADVEHAFDLLQQEGDKQFTYSLGSCSDASAVDHAVTDLLNSLGLPFLVPIRRLGPGGDYFIDRRLHVRLVGGQVMVRCRSQSSSSSSTTAAPFEHLGKYLIHLYAPLLVADEKREPSVTVQQQERDEADSDVQKKQPVGENAVMARKQQEDEAHVVRLQQQQQQLQRSLAVQQEMLRQHHRELLAELSPSPEKQARPAQDKGEAKASVSNGSKKLVSGWRRPPSPSPEASRLSESPEARGFSPPGEAPQGGLNQMLQQRQRQLLMEAGVRVATPAAPPPLQPSKENDVPAAKPKKKSNVTLDGGRHLDLSQLTPEELERLKRAALAQQVREMKHSANRSLR